MRTLTVDLGDRSYPIHIGAGLLGDRQLLARALRARQVMIVTNEVVAPLYLATLREAFGDRRLATLVLPDGESHKTLATMERIITALLEAGFDRGCAIAALGGGVIGDLAGFAAACYQRGVDFVQVPTTLLAQVDSAVGGKTGVNHPLGKNMIGAFHQPRCVIADTATLATLPARELSAGLAEVIKYGLLRDRDLFAWLEDNIERLRGGDPAALAYAVERSCANKAAVVSDDEREAGMRALLNLGHTFGHAIETGLGYGRWLHGEAVGAGIHAAARLSMRLGWLEDSAMARIDRLLARAGLPGSIPGELEATRMLELMAVDKKARDGCMRLVLLRAIGDACISAEVDPGIVRAVLQECRAETAGA